MSKVFALIFATLTLVLLCSAPAGSAQVSINIGVAPECPYGYFSYPPIRLRALRLLRARLVCWRGVLGAGPWFHGPAHFSGHVDNRV